MGEVSGGASPYDPDLARTTRNLQHLVVDVAKATVVGEKRNSDASASPVKRSKRVLNCPTSLFNGDKRRQWTARVRKQRRRSEARDVLMGEGIGPAKQGPKRRKLKETSLYRPSPSSPSNGMRLQNNEDVFPPVVPILTTTVSNNGIVIYYAIGASTQHFSFAGGISH
ncbi:MAG: hypothetical protein M1831_006045 [Alyxoria varia]|nr:MAG: hypothetical protein M1831_006045 [Alyxoria varia]